MKLIKSLTAASILALSSCVAQPAMSNPITADVHEKSMLEVQTLARSTKDVYNTQGIEGVEAKGKESVASNLLDPSSAMFRNLQVKSFAEGYVLCGEVNAKNRYGGYVGFQPFVAGTNSATMLYRGKYAEINYAANAGIRAACGIY